MGGTIGSLFSSNSGEYDSFVAALLPDSSFSWDEQFGTGSSDFATGVAIGNSSDYFVCGYTYGRLFGSGEVSEEGEVYLTRYSSGGNQLWAKQIGNVKGALAFDVETDTQGNIYVVGSAEGLYDQNANSTNAFLAKFDPSGNLVWGREFGSTHYGAAGVIKTDRNDNVYVAGIYDHHEVISDPDDIDQNAFLAKFDSNGNQQWLNIIGSDGMQEIVSLTVDEENNLFAVGGTTSNLYGTNAGGEDAFVVEFSSSGNTIWSYQFGTNADDSAEGIARGDNGTLYIAGSTSGSLFTTNAGGQDCFVLALAAVAEPGYDLPEGTHVGSQSVEITCATTGATIRYTTDGSEPTSSSTEYTGPVTIDHSLTLKTKAWKTDYLPSYTQSAEYTLQLPTPAFDPDGGSYTGSQNVAISCSVNDVTIRYTTDGSDPDENSILYTEPVTLTESATLKAKAWKTGWSASEIKSADYVIQ